MENKLHSNLQGWKKLSFSNASTVSPFLKLLLILSMNYFVYYIFKSLLVKEWRFRGIFFFFKIKARSAKKKWSNFALLWKKQYSIVFILCFMYIFSLFSWNMNLFVRCWKNKIRSYIIKFGVLALQHIYIVYMLFIFNMVKRYKQ